MINDANIQYAITLLSDWAKWLITVETGVIAIIGSIMRSLPEEQSVYNYGREWLSPIRLAKVLATITIAFFLLSIASAALLLLSLPEIAITIQPGTNIWPAKDNLIGDVLGLDIQTLAIYESLGFGIGMVCFSLVVILSVWAKQKNAK